VFERLKIWLRGDYNSIRHKFMILPREWLEYIFLYRLRGKSWIDFYANRLNRFEKKSADIDLKVAYKMDGQVHLDYMISQGLDTSNTFLDYGCGVCRSGVYFAKFLDPGKYTGVDISRERLSRAKKLMQEEGIPAGDFRIKQVKDCRLLELEGMTFDYIFANSVLTHMPEPDIRTMLVTFRSLLSPSGKFYFTYAEADERKRRNIKDFWYRQDEIRGFCEEAGYNFTVLDDWPKTGDVMARASVEEKKGTPNGG